MLNKNSCKIVLVLFSFLILLGLALSQVASAQDNWTALPPYNTLWPLWSPVLSPSDPITGVPTPIVTALTPNTVLPIEPGLTWNPYLANPWLLYNTPLGMVYFDPLFGLNSWPPNSFIDASGLPVQLSLPVNYASLPPTDILWLNQNVSLANSAISLYLTWHFQTPRPPTFYLDGPQLLSTLPLNLPGPSPLSSLFAALPIP